MIKANAHNLIFVTLMAALGFFLLKLANRSFLGNVPVVGGALRVVEQAA